MFGVLGPTKEVEKELLDKINEAEGRTEEPRTLEIMPEKKEWLARTADNKDVYIDSETLEHMQAHPDVDIAHIREAIGKMEMPGPFKIESVDLGRTIGKDNCVEITPEDSVTMLYRKGRDGTTPIANKEPADTSLITIGMCLDDDGKYTMFTAFNGQLAPKEPWDKSLSPEEKEGAEQFWNTHALVASNDAIDWERSEPLLAAKRDELQTHYEELQHQILEMSPDEPMDKKWELANEAKAIKQQIKELSGDTKDNHNKNTNRDNKEEPDDL